PTAGRVSGRPRPWLRTFAGRAGDGAGRAGARACPRRVGGGSVRPEPRSRAMGPTSWRGLGRGVGRGRGGGGPAGRGGGGRGGGGLGVEPLEGRALPSFLAAAAFDAGSTPRSVAVGDFNGDGVQDLAVANYSSASVSVLLGRGDGSFGPPVGYAAGSGPASVA